MTNADVLAALRAVRDETEKWRERAKRHDGSSDWDAGYATALRHCAGDVDMALSALPVSVDAPAQDGAQALRETLAALAHEQWSGWMRHLFSRCYFTPDGAAFMEVPDTKRWQRQMSTPYAELSDAEKDSDRKEADRVLAALAIPRSPSGDRDALLDEIVQQVAELPDRTSPDDWPEAMLVTAAELRSIVDAVLAGAGASKDEK